MDAAQTFEFEEFLPNAAGLAGALAALHQVGGVHGGLDLSAIYYSVAHPAKLGAFGRPPEDRRQRRRAVAFRGLGDRPDRLATRRPTPIGEDRRHPPHPRRRAQIRPIGKADLGGPGEGAALLSHTARAPARAALHLASPALRGGDPGRPRSRPGRPRVAVHRWLPGGPGVTDLDQPRRRPSTTVVPTTTIPPVAPVTVARRHLLRPVWRGRRERHADPQPRRRRRHDLLADRALSGPTSPAQARGGSSIRGRGRHRAGSSCSALTPGNCLRALLVRGSRRRSRRVGTDRRRSGTTGHHLASTCRDGQNGHWLIWMVDLPQQSDGTYSSSMAEVRFIG